MGDNVNRAQAPFGGAAPLGAALHSIPHYTTDKE